MADEALSLDGLNLNDGTTFYLETISDPPPRQRPEWVAGADSNGARLGRHPQYDNREITLRVRVVQQSTMNLALDKVGDLVDKLEEAKNQERGLALTWTPADSSRTVTAYVLLGEIDEIPKSWDGQDAGWFIRSPVMTVRLTCDPFWYGTEYLANSVGISTPLIGLELTNVLGDVPAYARVLIVDGASQTRRHVEGGLESRHYPTSSPPSLVIDSDGMNVGGTAGTDTTRTGAYDPNASGNNVIRATLVNRPVAVCKTGEQTHVGSFRVKARVYAATSDPTGVWVRLAWNVGGGLERNNQWVQPAVGNAFSEIDLGVITLPEAVTGVSRWAGTVQAYSTLSGVTLDVDMLQLIPCGEAYFKAVGEYVYRPGVVVAWDTFSSSTAGGNLNGRAASLGGSWVEAGVGTALLFSDGPTSGDETVTRTTTSDTGYRIGVLGATNYSNTETAMELQVTTGSPRPRIIARYVDADNYAFAEYDFDPTTNALRIGVRVAGAETILNQVAFARSYNEWWQGRLTVYASGLIVGELLKQGARILQVAATHASLVTGGSLDDGKPAFGDQNTGGACTRYYDQFYVSTPPAETAAIYSGQSLEVRSDTVIQEDSTGSYWSRFASRGGYIEVPPAGDENRKARLVVKARRNNVEMAEDIGLTDATSVYAYITPRFLTVPR